MDNETKPRTPAYMYLVKQTRNGKYITVIHLDVSKIVHLKELSFLDSIDTFANTVFHDISNMIMDSKDISVVDKDLACYILKQAYYDEHYIDTRYAYTLKEDSNFTLGIEITFITPDAYSKLTKEFISIPFSELNLDREDLK